MLQSGNKLEVAVVGLGVGFEHALAYLKTNVCTLRWVCDLDRTKMNQVLKEIGQGKATESFETIVQDDKVDIVSIASYDDAHFSQVVAALYAGKHVFVEKPLCRSLEELREIKQVWLKSDTPHLLSNLVLREAPVYRWLKHAISSDDLGEIYAVDGDYLYGRIHKITEDWRKDVPNYSVMQGGGVHLVDLMLWFSGAKPDSVTAVGNRICTAGTDFRYNDYVTTTFKFSSGLIGRITANFGCMHPHQHVLRVFGTKGTFIYDDQGPRLHTNRAPTVTPTSLELSPLPSSKGDLIPNFVEGILAGKDTNAQSQHEFDVISACVAVDEALQTSKEVSIHYI